MNRSLAVAAALLLAVTVAACGTRNNEPEYVELPVEQLYNEAMDALLAENFRRAANRFDEVERQHPYSTWATKAQLLAAYAHFRNERFDDAVIGLDRFIQLHPGNPDVAYAYYLKALSYYTQISDVGRDQSMTRRAMESLDEVIRRFPNTEYARDARLKLDLTRDHLAGKEMDIGRFYLRQRHHLAAINRFRTVLDEYQTTSHAPEALHRLAEAYTALGMDEEAYKVAAVLGYNYPGSEWYVDSYRLVEEGDIRGERRPNPGPLRRAWNSIF